MTKSNGRAIALALAGLALTCAAEGPDKAERAGAKAAARAARALAHQQPGQAVVEAERAVAAAPSDAAFRMVLGQSYLQAGRFASARAAFAETLQLDPTNGRAALNLALSETALGDWQAAQRTLAAHGGFINDSDRGLALALAGDTAGAVSLLTTVARSPAATPKVRQNLALAYALAGQWQLARAVAAADMSPAEVDQRLEQWAVFAQPHGAADQVASLMNVHPAHEDAGEPTAIALVTPVAPPAVGAAPVAVAVAAPAPVVVPVAPVATAVVTPVSYAPPRPMIQPLPSASIAAEPGPFKTSVHTRMAAKPAQVAPVAGGKFVVQLGAYADMAVARHAWSRAGQRVAALAGHQAEGVNVKAGSATLYRLSVGGFSRAGADQLCHQYRAKGGDCFVRAAAGDQVARWDAPATKAVAPAPVKVAKAKSAPAQPVVKVAAAKPTPAQPAVKAAAKPAPRKTQVAAR